MTKQCSGKCKETKDINDFGKDSRYKDGKNVRCKACNRKLASDWYKANSEKAKKRITACQKANPMLGRKYRLKREYGLTLEQYDAMLTAQNGVCDICKTKDDKALCVDHDHSTGKIRGLLCNNCNKMLGLADDQISILLNANSYLTKHLNGL